MYYFCVEFLTYFYYYREIAYDYHSCPYNFSFKSIFYIHDVVQKCITDSINE